MGLYHHERNSIICAKQHHKSLKSNVLAIVANLAKVGVEGSNPFARSNEIKGFWGNLEALLFFWAGFRACHLRKFRSKASVAAAR